MGKRAWLTTLSVTLLAGCGSGALGGQGVLATGSDGATATDGGADDSATSATDDAATSAPTDASTPTDAATDAAKADAVAPRPDATPPSGCPAVTFPSGLVLDTVKDDALTAQYVALGVTGCAAPSCFIDVTSLTSPDGSTHDVHAKIADHFELYELIATEVDPNATGNVDPAHAYSTRVLVDPNLVSHLETMRGIYGSAVTLTSGFRSPPHQRAVCESICGAPSCTDASGTVTCAKNSRHMWGAAADMSLVYESAATAAGFPFVFHEGGGTAPHLHVDMRACE